VATSPKITPLEELARRLEHERAAGRAVVHCHGVFDLLHIGHIRYLQKAKRLGDVLAVTLTPDRFVNKGPQRPAFPEGLRADALAALDCVDYVAINDQPTAAATIERLKPAVFAKGSEYRDRKTPELLAEEAAAAAIGARVEFVEDVTSSSSHLINTYHSPFPEATDRYLAQFRAQYSPADVLGWLDRARDLRVLVVGEAILEEYYDCTSLGQSNKAPIVAVKFQSQRRFPGGALAVANHLAGFCGRVDLLTMLGADDSEEAWVRSGLRPGVSPAFLFKAESPTIVKRRYRESYFSIPLFEINFLNDRPLSEADDRRLRSLLEDAIPEHDLVVVADYGHTMLSEPAVNVLCEQSKFLAVSTQLNAANHGYHSIGRYSRADYATLGDQELHLECRAAAGERGAMLNSVARRLGARQMAVTVGAGGCLCVDGSAAGHHAPALATRVADRYGAGEAFLAVTSLCAAVEAPVPVLAFLGNVAGAEAVAVVGSSQSLDRSGVQRQVETLLK
jgi:rfaE bifunctional protein nucleotidyltransferase chain/domain